MSPHRDPPREAAATCLAGEGETAPAPAAPARGPLDLGPDSTL